MNNTFSIEIGNAELGEMYFLHGECEINGKNVLAFDINKNRCSFTGFGGNSVNKLSKIAILQIEIKYTAEIIKAIEKQIKEGLY